MSESGGVGGSYLAQAFGNLPRELADKILDDLTLFKVLQLATWADPAVTAHILEHKHYGRVFWSAKLLDAAAPRFAIWCQVKNACGWPNSRHLFGINPMSSLFSGVTYNALMDDMDKDIKEGCRNASPYRPLLSQFSPEPVWPGLTRTETQIKLHLQQIWSAQETIKQLESRQLRVVADFLETYPDMLRWAYDPRGDASTTPPVHNVQKLRIYAKKVFNTEYMRRRKPVHCSVAFRNGIVPIVPRNWCLQLLLGSDMPDEVVEGLRKQRTRLEDLTDALQHTRLAASSTQRHPSPPLATVSSKPSPTSLTAQRPLTAPAAAASQQSSPQSREYAVTKDLRTVFEGLTHRYARPDHLIDGTPIARIASSDGLDIGNWFMKSSEERKQIIEHGQACFVTPSRAELSRRAGTVAIRKDGLRVWGKRAKVNFHVQPYHLQELEWLGAFLRSVAYLKKTEKRA